MNLDVLSMISTNMGTQSQEPNIQLAQLIVNHMNADSVSVLVQNLSGKNKQIQGDCIKVLYEIGELAPVLIAPYTTDFLKLLNSKNNRLQWGGMAALKSISTVKPETLYQHLNLIVDAADRGSVITRDGAVEILVNLCRHDANYPNAIIFLHEQMMTCPSNQLPMYAERAKPIYNQQNALRFLEILNERLNELGTESKKKRTVKVISFLGKVLHPA